MRYLDDRTMIDRGRKAGLGTSDLYRALAARRPEGGSSASGRADGNGFVPGIDTHGHRVYVPVGSGPRP